MPRRHYRKVEAAQNKPDHVYGDVKLRLFINTMMKDGKYAKSATIMYGALNLLMKEVCPNENDAEKNAKAIETFEKVINNAAPRFEVKSRRVGGATYQVPIEVRDKRRVSLAFRWILQFARARSEKTMTLRLYKEMLDVYNQRGSTIKKKDDTHKMADSNRAFAVHKKKEEQS
jgi:small subunit ribosomal protein S7